MSSLYMKQKAAPEIANKLYGHLIVSDRVVRQYVLRIQKGTFVSELYNGAPIVTVKIRVIVISNY